MISKVLLMVLTGTPYCTIRFNFFNRGVFFMKSASTNFNKINLYFFKNNRHYNCVNLISSGREFVFL